MLHEGKAKAGDTPVRALYSFIHPCHRTCGQCFVEALQFRGNYFDRAASPAYIPCSAPIAVQRMTVIQDVFHVLHQLQSKEPYKC